jgi:hypothetical protein
MSTVRTLAAAATTTASVRTVLMTVPFRSGSFHDT